MITAYVTNDGTATEQSDVATSAAAQTTATVAARIDDYGKHAVCMKRFFQGHFTHFKILHPLQYLWNR